MRIAIKDLDQNELEMLSSVVDIALRYHKGTLGPKAYETRPRGLWVAHQWRRECRKELKRRGAS